MPIGIRLDVNWYPICKLGLALQWHQNVFRLSDCHWIGRLQVWRKTKIWPKSRLLIGRELGMLASHWSRGPQKIFQRGYPYDPESQPIECFWPQLVLDWFILDWHRIVFRLVVNWHQIGRRLAFDWGALDWVSIVFRLVLSWHQIGRRLAFDLGALDSVSIVFRLVLNWYQIGCRLAFYWGFNLH